MAKFKVIGGRNPQTINPSLTENEFPNTSALFNIGNFTITSNFSSNIVKNFKDELTVFSNPITLDVLNITTIEELDVLINFSTDLTLNFDKKNLNNYALYGSLSDRIISALNNIITKFPGSLYITNTDTNGSYYNNILQYTYDSLEDKSTFKIPSFLIQNDFGLTYVNNSQHLTDVDDLKNLNFSYNKYVLYTLDQQLEFDLTSFIGSYQNNSGYITITVEGNPFPIAYTAGTDSKLFHIKPNAKEYTYFYNSLDPFEKYILSQDSDPLYTMVVKVPFVNEDDQLYFNDKKYTFPVKDGYNIDTVGNNFKIYSNSLIDLAETYDKFKSDIVYRMFMPDSVKDTDLTDNSKSRQFSRIFGREMDEIKNFIDGIVYVNNISYDKIENVPDKLVKNLANTLGWKDFNIIEVEDLFASIFDSNVTSTTSSTTPADLDIEMWRRILINTQWLFKSKGTRKAIEAIFGFIGVPNCLVDINEHVYTVDGKINPETVDLDLIFPLNETLTVLPYDEDGYPQAFSESPDFYFQLSGDSDSGQAYINVYRALGFNVTKTVDNKKSWVYTETAETRYDDFTSIETNYSIKESKLVINTKELSVNLDPIKAIECDVYAYNFNYNYPVSSTGRTFPYPQRLSNMFNVSELTFSEYVNEVYSTFVNAQNRKTVDDGRGGGYPSLTKLYNDYLYRSLSEGGHQSNQYNLKKIFNYVKNFQNYITKFFDQLAPATVIFEQNGIKIRNTVFTPQKFVYKHGIDAGSEFAVSQPQNVSDNLNPISFNTSSVILPIKNTIKIWESIGTYNFSSGPNSGGPHDPLLTITQTLRGRDRWSSELFVFNIPQYTMSGATKIVTGITDTSIYYYDDDVVGKDLYFNITANTECLSATTNPCIFHFNVYEYDPLISGFTTNVIYSKDIPYTNFTGGTFSFNEIVPKSSLNPDAEYLIKGFATSTVPAPTADTITYGNPLDYYDIFDKYIYPAYSSNYEFFYDDTKYSGYTGTTLTSLDASTGKTYNIYNSQDDWYFVSLGNPEEPSLINLDEGATPTPDAPFYYYENILLTGTNQIVTTYTPIGDVQIVVNGSSLLKNTEYVLETNVISSLQNRVYNITVPVFNSGDTISVAYLANSNSFNFANDYLYITYIPTGSTETPPNKVLYNTTNSKYEYYLTVPSSGDTNQIQVTWNGQSLTPNSDYTLSIANNRRIIFTSIQLATGDTLSVYYITGNTSAVSTFVIQSNPFLFEWTTPNPLGTEDGIFTLEFTNPADIMFTGITSSVNTTYVPFNSYFNYNADFINDTQLSGLTLGNTYNVRVKSTKYYDTIAGDILSTNNYSTRKIVKLPS